MFSWWTGANQEPASDARRLSHIREQNLSSSQQQRAKRLVKTQHVEVQVIGGASSSRTAMQKSRISLMHASRLPHELYANILVLACFAIVEQAAAQGTSCIGKLLTLASIDSRSYQIVFSRFVLPSLTLTGERQVALFARSLQRRNALGMRKLSHHICRLAIRRAAPMHNKNHQAQQQSASLYADVEETTQFERTTLASLRTILSCCTGLQQLSLDMTARVLDLRWPDDVDKAGLMTVCSSLTELVTMLSLYGGDLNERLWDPTYGAKDVGPTRWANLTHLQLHGPRFRMTAHTALALCDLPSLTHLALVMPWVVNTTMNADSVASSTLARHAHAIQRASDALGRQSVLQLLLSGLGHRLTMLALICHDMDGYLGSVQKLGPWFRALHWQSYTDPAQDVSPCGMGIERLSKTQLVLVTAQSDSIMSEGTASSCEPHPSLLSKWMLNRVGQQRHWTFDDGEQQSISGFAFTLAVESWRVPIVHQKPQYAQPRNNEEYDATSQHYARRPDFSTAQRWMGIRDAQEEEEGDDDDDDDDLDVGIDNLD